MSKKIDGGIVGFAKRVYLKYFVGYSDPQSYWDKRYDLNLKSDWSQERSSPVEIERFNREVAGHMLAYGCSSILEVGCGRGKHRCLPGWVGLDFSVNCLKQSRLTEFVFADFSKHIPLPAGTFDCVMCQYVLLHVPTVLLESAVGEMCRVASKLVIVCEPKAVGDAGNFSFNHDLKKYFKQFSGHVFFTVGDGEYERWV